MDPSLNNNLDHSLDHKLESMLDHSLDHLDPNRPPSVTDIMSPIFADPSRKVSV